MANQAVVSTSMSITRGSLNRPLTSNDVIVMTGLAGPTPGNVLAAVNHTVVNLTALTTPGLCRIQNLDANNTVYYGIYSSHYNDFFPLGRLLPGMTNYLYLSDLLGKDLTPVTGTGPGDAFTNNFALKALTAPCWCLVEVFDQ